MWHAASEPCSRGYIGAALSSSSFVLLFSFYLGVFPARPISGKVSAGDDGGGDYNPAVVPETGGDILHHSAHCRAVPTRWEGLHPLHGVCDIGRQSERERCPRNRSPVLGCGVYLSMRQIPCAGMRRRVRIDRLEKNSNFVFDSSERLLYYGVERGK